jgi:lipocalin
MKSSTVATVLALSLHTSSALSPLVSVNVSAYIGRWYQSYASSSVAYTFQLGGNCVTADYNVTDLDDVVSVRNIVRPVNGAVPIAIAINGYAIQDPNIEGALDVRLVLSRILLSPRHFRVVMRTGFWTLALSTVLYNMHAWLSMAIVCYGTVYQRTINTNNIYCSRADDA